MRKRTMLFAISSVFVWLVGLSMDTVLKFTPPSEGFVMVGVYLCGIWVGLMEKDVSDFEHFNENETDGERHGY